MPVDLAITDQVKQLRRAGIQPSERLVQTILRAGATVVGPLLDLARETNLLYEDAPECFAPIHALRLLGELRPVEMIEPLLDLIPLEPDYFEDEPSQMWATEAPQMIGRLGAAAVEALWAIADDESWDIDARGAALTSLAYATITDPALREDVVAGLRERLARSDDRELSTHLITALANLGVGESYSEVMRLYREGRIDQDLIPAAVARQLLLSDPESRLACVHHPLWERYEHHGPFAEEREV